MANVIKTNIKFKKNSEGHLYGFVTKTDGSWRGVREEEKVKKKIVFVDPMAEKNMKPGLLYRSLLVPMTDGNGFICLNATKMIFKAQIKSYDIPEHGFFRVEVRFGNKCISYNPSSKEKKYNDMQSIADMLRKREDIRNPMAVADMFLDAATVALTLYKRELKGE